VYLLYEAIYKTNDSSSGKPCFVSLTSLLCNDARNFEKVQISEIKIIHVVGRRFVDKYCEFHFCLFLMFRMCLFSDTKSMDIILVYKANMKPCGFYSVYSDSQLYAE